MRGSCDWGWHAERHLWQCGGNDDHRKYLESHEAPWEFFFLGGDAGIGGHGRYAWGLYLVIYGYLWCFGTSWCRTSTASTVYSIMHIKLQKGSSSGYDLYVSLVQFISYICIHLWQAPEVLSTHFRDGSLWMWTSPPLGSLMLFPAAAGCLLLNAPTWWNAHSWDRSYQICCHLAAEPRKTTHGCSVGVGPAAFTAVETQTCLLTSN